MESMDTDANFLAFPENFKSNIPVTDPPKDNHGYFGNGENLFYLYKLMYTIS